MSKTLQTNSNALKGSSPPGVVETKRRSVNADKTCNATLQRLAQHSAFKLPSKTKPFVQVTPIAVEGESASEMLLRERR